MLLTELKIKNLKPKAKPYRVREKGSDRGFGVQVSSGGRRTFFMAYTVNGKERFMKLGVYPESSLADARDRCRDARKLVDQGKDPQEIKRKEDEIRKVQIREEALRGSVEQLFQNYIDYLKAEKSPGSVHQVQLTYNKDVIPIVAPTMKAKDVTPQHIRLILNRITNRGSLIQANRARSYLMAAFKHGIEHDHNPMNLNADVLFSLKFNPVRDIPRIVKREKVGKRDLSTDELARFWRSLDEYQGMDGLTALAFRLILATDGQRIKEVTQGRWAEFDIDRRLWEMVTSKNGKPHLVPLNDLAISLLKQLHPLTGDGKYLFPKRGDNTECLRLDSMSKALLRYCKRTGFKKFTPRDLRRTCKTRMGELGLSKEIRDRLHNHALNDVSSKHYDRYDYLPEKTLAITAWGEYLERIIAPEKENDFGADIVPIKQIGTS